MKILHVVRGLRHSSGTTTTVVPLSEEQARRGHKVAIYFVEQGAAEPMLPSPALVETRCFPMSLPLWHPGISAQLAKGLQSSVREFDIVHIHAVWNFPTWWAMRTALQAGVPYIVSPQGSFEPWALGQSRWRKSLYARLTEIPLMNRAAFVQALTLREAEQMRAAGVTTTPVVIPNGVHPDEFRHAALPLAECLGLSAGRRTVLSLSRVHKKKGIDVLIRGFAQAAAEIADTDLVIAGGDGGSGYAGELARLAADLRIDARVHFIGEVKGSNKLGVLAGADVFALISHSEGLPVASLEAMASGLPVILTPGCNVPEVAEHGAGLVVDVTPAAVATALRALLADRDTAKRMGAAGRTLVNERFSWAVVATKTLEAYAQARRFATSSKAVAA